MGETLPHELLNSNWNRFWASLNSRMGSCHPLKKWSECRIVVESLNEFCHALLRLEVQEAKLLDTDAQRKKLLQALVDAAMESDLSRGVVWSGPRDLPRRWLPHGSYFDLYTLYCSHQLASSEPAASKTTFYRVLKESQWKKKSSNFHLRVHTQNVRPVPGWRAKSRTRRGSRPIQRHVISSFATSVASSAIVHATGNVEPVPKQLQTCYVWSVTPWIVQNMPFQDFTGAEFQRILKPPSGQHWRWPPKLFMGLESTLILQTKTKRLGQIGYWKPWIVPCNQYTAAWEELENLYRQFLNSLQITHPKILIFIESKILLWSMLTSLFQIFWSWCSTWLAFSSCLLPLIALKLRRWKTRSLDATAAWWWEEGTSVPSPTNIYPLDTRMKTLAPRLHLIPLWFRSICWYQLYGPRCVFRYALSLCPRRGWQIAPRSNTAVQKLWGCQIILISKLSGVSRQHPNDVVEWHTQDLFFVSVWLYAALRLVSMFPRISKKRSLQTSAN